MNLTLLKAKAIALEAQLQLHAPLDPEAIRLWSALKPLLTLAKAEQISQPLETREVPGRYLFTEKNLQQYGELEEAYATFAIELTGGETPALRAFRESMRSRP
ncbi:hypothetical protein ABDX87_24860 [Pseudomonas abietaniphila]|uniref:hypothetical protein n=1 Tax=Pseudomonas abietaniphila TaxID=89065 RepID=UPI003216D40F